MADPYGDDLEVDIPLGATHEEREQLIEEAASKKFAADMDRLFREAGLKP